MSAPHDPNRTAGLSSTPDPSLDAGLAAGFGRPADGPGSVLEGLRSHLGPLGPVLLGKAEGESAHVVKPHSDAMPATRDCGTRYQLQGEIARGGMGAILRGRDVDLGRDLAVKVLLEKYVDRPEVARRFLEEAQIGGQLQHPGVVPVYDIGRFGDRPFFTMKLVKGKTLAALLGERRTPVADAPGSPRELPRFLGIAVKVAETLAYAHAKGVIHRDLKPANVMVGAFGEVQVMDWGLAKVLAEGGVADEEKASRERERPEGATEIRTARSSGSAGTFGTATEAGSLLGTPAYMPPEQANGDIANVDRRCDVFGLGAILCEILTSKPPYVGRSAEEVRRKAANGDLADARTRLGDCGADAELIGLTIACLAPEAMDRPRDALAVADALTAYLDGVQARLHHAELAEAAARARAVEEARRRRLTLALAATVLSALTLGGGTWLWLKSERDARQAQLTRDVNEALNQATRLRTEAQQKPSQSAALLAQAREQTQRALALVESGPADADLKAQAEHLQRDLDEEANDHQLLADLEAARLAQAETVAGENRFAQEVAVPLYRQALRAFGLPVGKGEPAAAAARIRARPAPVREAIIDALDEWTDLVNYPRLHVAEPHLDWLRAVTAAAEPDDGWTRRLRSALAEKPAGRRRQALETLAGSGIIHKQPPRVLTRLARQLYFLQAPAPAVKLLRRAQEQYPADFWVNHDLALILTQTRPPGWAEAVRYYTAAVALRPKSPGVYLNLAIALRAHGQLDEAIACYRPAIDLTPKYAAAHNNLGVVLCDSKHDYAGAIACFRKAIDLDPKFAKAHGNLGNALRKQGQIDAAIAAHRKALRINPRLADVRSNLGELLREHKHDAAGAIACFRQAIDIDPKFVPAHLGLGFVLADARHDYAQAIACFRRAVALDPTNVRAHFNLGTSLQACGQLDEAIACFRLAAELDPKDAGAHNNLGNVLQTRGRLDEAIASYQKAMALDPRNPKRLSNLGNALVAKGKLDQALDCFRQAIALDPKYAMAHNGLGNVLRDQSRFDEAMACYRRAIVLDPKNVAAHNNLGNVLQARRRLDEAAACFRQAIQIDPKQASYHFNLGNALADQGRLDEAIPCFRKTIELNPKEVGAYNNLGIALQTKGRQGEAIVCFRRATELAPQKALPHANLGSALVATGRLDEAIACLRKAITLDPKVADFHLRLGAALVRQDRPEEAIACFRRAVALDPKRAFHYHNLGCVLEDTGRLDEAVAAYRQAIALDPKFPLSHGDLGNALRAKGQLDEAIAGYRRALALDPKDAFVHRNLGVALQAKGRLGEAVASYRRALALDPGDGQARFNLPRAERMALVQDKVPAFHKGKYQPATDDERVGLALWCQTEKRYHAAARLFADVFAANPKRADDLNGGYRYDAACLAALAATGQAKDATRLDKKERTQLRRQALAWLRADLGLRVKQLETGQPASIAAVQQALKHWQKDSDLGGLRDATALAKLPAEECAVCEKFWAAVAALLKKAENLLKKDGNR
jgi:serine/threonine-protein kinase